MPYRPMALVAALLVLGTMVSCVTSPPFHYKKQYPPLPGVSAGQKHTEVIAAVGHPTDRASGYWTSSLEFDMEYTVYYYKAKGRVIFSKFDGLVYASEADTDEDGRPGAETP